MKKSNKIPEEFIIESAWCAIRYYLGRHTISATAYPADFVANVMPILSDNKCETIKNDIRDMINDQINWYKNIHIENRFTKSAYGDAVQILAKSMNDTNTKLSDFSKFEFEINLATGFVSMFPKDSSDDMIGFSKIDISDLLHWVNLANFMDKKRFKIKTKNHGELDNAFKFLSVDYQNDCISIHYTTDEYYKQGGHIYIDPEQIVEVYE